MIKRISVKRNLTGSIDSYIMVPMRSCRNNENTGQLKEEISHLRKGFTALQIDYKRGVLKTAQGLLKVQKMYKKIIMGNARHSMLSAK